jgi:hypothetical protein
MTKDEFDTLAEISIETINYGKDLEVTVKLGHFWEWYALLDCKVNSDEYYDNLVDILEYAYEDCCEYLNS